MSPTAGRTAGRAGGLFDVLYLFIPGTPEIGGLTSVQALEIIHGCRGLNIVGGDLVEVSE